MSLSVVLILIQAIIFGIKKEDRQWVPRPDQNYLSWAYGFFIISAFFTLFSAITLVLASRDFKRKLKQDYPDRRYWDTQTKQTLYVISTMQEERIYKQFCVSGIPIHIYHFSEMFGGSVILHVKFLLAWIQKNFFWRFT